ncbi:Uncharacterised protein [Shigella sonnei]|nr:Uncharacterised protein [Shigella sonnei]CSP66952.1 Uncharacterised protein [Shigella sonnei]CSP97625.1 Uncharacterised protein [Shigella sonnei]CSQ81163.1 Uncharacterised protein [Shigella sonnei]
MHGSDSTRFRLHFNHAWCVSPNVLQAVSGPGISLFCHRGTGGNRVDGDNFTGAKRHRSNRAITINSNHMTPLHCANEGRTKLLRAQ